MVDIVEDVLTPLIFDINCFYACARFEAFLFQIYTCFVGYLMHHSHIILAMGLNYECKYILSGFLKSYRGATFIFCVNDEMWRHYFCNNENIKCINSYQSFKLEISDVLLYHDWDFSTGWQQQEYKSYILLDHWTQTS